MRAVLFMLFIVSNEFVFAQAEEQQFFGTHAFISLPTDYTFSSNIGFSYIKDDYSVAFTGARAFDGVQNTEKQFASSGMRAEILPDSQKTVFVRNTGTGAPGSVQLFTIVGNKKESAIVSATVYRMNDASSIVEEIKKTLATVVWKEVSSLNFEAAMFYEPMLTYELKPAAIVANRIVYTVNGETLVNYKFSLQIGKNIVNGDFTKNPAPIVDRILQVENGDARIVSNTQTHVQAGGLAGTKIVLQLDQDGSTVKKQIVVFIQPKEVYFIIEESNSLDFDHYFDHFDDIVQGFELLE